VRLWQVRASIVSKSSSLTSEAGFGTVSICCFQIFWVGAFYR
jgi:hypothetical protein